MYQRVKLMWVARPPGPEVLETARVVAARASLRALRLAPTPLTAQRSAAMEMVLLPLELGGCGTMDPATTRGWGRGRAGW